MDKTGGPAAERAFQYLVWLVPVIEKLPRSQKFLIGDRLQTAALDVLETLTDAAWNRDRSGLLRVAQLRIERQRILMRLLAELKLVDLRRYEHAVRELDEIGRLIGGWRKANTKRGDGEATR